MSSSHRIAVLVSGLVALPGLIVLSGCAVAAGTESVSDDHTAPADPHDVDDDEPTGTARQPMVRACFDWGTCAGWLGGCGGGFFCDYGAAPTLTCFCVD